MNDRARSDLQAKINRTIPLSEAMGYRITELDTRHIVVTAPLAPNINIHGSGFAGSIYALGILTAWGLCAHLIANAGINADLVVVEATIRYRAPVRGNILCRCEIADEVASAFISELSRKGRSQVVLQVPIGEVSAARIEAKMHASLA
jgi:thioesterase domain-containing protein